MMNLFNNDYKKINKHFLAKEYHKIINNFQLDRLVDNNNISRNLLIIKSHFNLENFDIAFKFLSEIDKQFNFHEVKFLIGIYFQKKNLPKQALIFFQNAIELNKKSPDYFNEAGNISITLGNYNLAIKYYKAVLSFDLPPQIQGILFSNIGNAYYNYGDYQKGIIFSKKSLNLNIKLFPARITLGLCYFAIKKYKESINTFEEILKINPNFESAINNLAVIYVEMGNFSLAKNYLNKLLKINSKNDTAYLNLGKCQSALREYDEAMDSFKKSFELNEKNLTSVSNYLLNLNYSDKFSQEKIVDEHVKMSKFFDKSKKDPNGIEKTNNSIIKIGYVSADFQNHSVMKFFLPIIFGYNKKKFKIYCLYNGTEFDESTHFVKNNCNFFDISKQSDEEVINLIKQENLDILIDLSGHTKGNRLSLFAKKPCKIQINWIGYPNTTGLKEIDYRIVDNFTDPPGSELKNYPEKLIRMSNFFMTFGGVKEYKILPPPCDINNYITFGSFNGSIKLNYLTIKIWSDILKNNTQNKLILKSFEFNDLNIQNRIKSDFFQFGVNEDQLIFYKKVSREEHFDLYNQIDIALDPTPYNGTTTSLEALWMGVPVIALEGSSHHSRVTHSILKNINLSELSAKDIDGYIKKAKELASDKVRIQKYKKNIRKMLLSSSIMNHKGFILELEKIFESLVYN